jgi:N-6 DNA Methylase
LLAMRGDAPYFAVLKPGTMAVYSVGLQENAQMACVSIAGAGSDLRMVIPHLANARPQIPDNRQWISDVILSLLKGALDKLVKTFAIADGDAISIVGRALFVRFLADRDLIPAEVAAFAIGGIAKLFDTPDSMAKVSEWLDATFNGDFLPLPDATIKALPAGAFAEVGNILRRAPEGQYHLEWEESWHRLNFAHIPVGVLSQAYEGYLNAHKKEKQKKEGSYYTPRHIAELMVRASFAALRRDGVAHSAKILDPAVGAGVFLITAFRQLVAERWRHDGRSNRPDTKTLREILETQITGFDINDSALRFAALGLYLMSIELDPDPQLVQKLGFKKLREIGVLYKFGVDDGVEGSKDLGSLGGEVGREHLGKYDLVIGNPPWAKATKLKNWKSVEAMIVRIARERLRDETVKAPLPNAVTDLPFVWRAMEWARPSGQIAFALHARVLFQRGEGMVDARNALFRSLDVTGIVNGAEVRHTDVWPKVQAPFCLVFAQNSLPQGGGFRFITPKLEGPLNDNGSWRIDSASADIVFSEQLVQQPTLLKGHFRGNSLDIELLNRISAGSIPPFEKFWRENFGPRTGRLKYAGNGYQSLKRSSRKRKDSDLPGVDAKYLWGIPELPSRGDVGLVIDATLLPKFESERIHDPRDISIFRGPLLLVRKAPPKKHGRIRTSISDNAVVYKASYYGYSAKAHAAGKALVRFLALVIGSKFSLWHVLVTSGEYGFERDTIEKYVIEEILIPSFEDLSNAERMEANQLFNQLALLETDETWQMVDDWVAKLFGLDQDDMAIISDTLTYSLPFKANRDLAQQPVNTRLRREFQDRLEAELRPWAERFGRPMSVLPLETPILSPWLFLGIGPATGLAHKKLNDDWAAAIGLSNHLSSTEIIISGIEADCLIIGRLNQARYWSNSQARLLARRIIWEHIDFFSDKIAR